MSLGFLTDKYAVYVLSAYGSTLLILGWMIWSALRANRKAREELERLERERRS